jgi:hypothetical protein
MKSGRATSRTDEEHLRNAGGMADLLTVVGVVVFTALMLGLIRILERV